VRAGHAPALYEYFLEFSCPTYGENPPQTFINGLDVQINGGVWGSEGCPNVEGMNWVWGDTSSNDSFFPATHTYPAPGDYTITSTAFDGDRNWLVDRTCVVSLHCETDADCDDGVFCNGTETCAVGTGNCVAVSACPPGIDGCVIRNDSCDEVNDQCVDFLDDSLCASSEMCVLNGDCLPIYTCVGFYAPFDEPMAVKKKSKRALPLKFNLLDGYVNEITDLSPPPIVEVRVLGTTGSEIDGWGGELLPAGLSDDTNEFYYDWAAGQWVLNLGMKAYTASATYTISVIAGDNSYVIDGCTENFTRN
jgi:hypothetical protein